jgi:hypothetical protein
MADKDIFDTSYVARDETAEVRTELSQVQAFLVQPIEEKEMSQYGTSKPKRMIIRARIAVLRRSHKLTHLCLF